MSEESIPYENLSTQLCYLKWPLLLQFDLLPKGLTVYEDIPNSNDLNIATGNKQNFTGPYGGVSTPPPSQNRYVWLYKTKSCPGPITLTSVFEHSIMCGPIHFTLKGALFSSC